MRSRGSRILGILALSITAVAAVWALLRTGGAPASPDDTAAADPPPARRVVSLIPAATEILFAIGAGQRVVGRTRWGVHPLEAAAVADVGDGIRPSLEAVLARDPDLVVLVEGSDNRGVSGRLRSLGIRTLPLTHNTLTDLERNVRALGVAVGCEMGAARLIARIRDDLAAVAADREGPRVRVYYDVWPDPPMTIGRGSYIDSLLTLAGADNVFGDLAPPSPQVSLEAIVRADPDFVLYSDVGGAEPPNRRPGWEHVPAIAAGRVAPIDGDLVGRLGPRVGAAARDLARALDETGRRGAPPAADDDPPAFRCAP